MSLANEEGWRAIRALAVAIYIQAAKDSVKDGPIGEEAREWLEDVGKEWAEWLNLPYWKRKDVSKNERKSDTPAAEGR